MNPTGGNTTGLSPDAFQTAINGVAYEEYMREQQPSYLSAQDSFFFRQSQASEMVYSWDEDSNVGAFRETGEQETITSDDTFIGNTKTARQRKWTKQIPVSFEAFKTEESYYATLFHETGHWTAHEKRLNRDLTGRFGTRKYAAEELVAELTSAFLCAHLSVEGELRHAGYVENWIELLKADERAIFTAASKASSAADYLRSFSQEELPTNCV